MMKLDERDWKDFAVPEIFQNIQRGKRLKNADHIPGIVPYVSSTANNNGVDDYIEATEGTRVFKNCISLANSGGLTKGDYQTEQGYRAIQTHNREYSGCIFK